ncbi:hypothetical protein SEA_FIDGETORCA_81 [Streptomyces phage FidgetOrca]|uniref:Uncharacterized protein n=1 Tax=Streptomyces phage FidgetOrca TaxID=2656619 RepID=A0A649VVX6_9CAUD|nr:hypothetical protein SEA_FIDGETORCA_81 [Streptomyces phage FidgetOrca]
MVEPSIATIYADHGDDQPDVVFKGTTEEAVFWLKHICGVDMDDPETALVVTYKVKAEGVDRPMTVAMFVARQCEHEPNDCCNECHICSEYLEMWA